MVAQPRSSSTKVIAGRFRGRALRYPAGRVLRPTMQRTREALFSSVDALLREAWFLDLFAGAGSVGIEALSRGARFVHFVERDRAIAAFLRENLNSLSVPSSRYEVHVADALEVMESGVLEGAPAAIVFADPPYDTADAVNVLELFDDTAYAGLVSLVLEHRRPLETARLRRLRVDREKRYGDARLTYFVPAGDGR